MLATYSGSKAFVSTFTSALAEEVRAHNITVHHLNTYFVVCLLSSILFLHTDHTIPGLKNVQDPEIDGASTHTCSLRPQCFEQDWAVVRGSLVRPPWHHHPVLEPCLGRLHDPCHRMEIFVHLVYPHVAQRYPSSRLEKVGARSKEGVEVRPKPYDVLRFTKRLRLLLLMSFVLVVNCLFPAFLRHAID